MKACFVDKSLHKLLCNRKKITDIAIFLKTETDTDVGIPKTEKYRKYRKTDHKKTEKIYFSFFLTTG